MECNKPFTLIQIYEKFSNCGKVYLNRTELAMEPLNTAVGVDSETISKRNKISDIQICEKHLEGTDNKYYNDGANYWSSVDPSVNGMLGGFGNISNIDIEGSAKFLKGLFKVIRSSSTFYCPKEAKFHLNTSIK